MPAAPYAHASHHDAYPDAATCHSNRDEHKGNADPCAHFALTDAFPDGLPLPVSVGECDLDAYGNGDGNP